MLLSFLYRSELSLSLLLYLSLFLYPFFLSSLFFSRSTKSVDQSYSDKGLVIKIRNRIY